MEFSKFRASVDSSILTTAQAAKILGVSTRTAQLWMENGSLASWKTPGGHRRTNASDVYALVRTQQGGPAETIQEQKKALKISTMSASGIPYPVGQDELARLAAVERSGVVDSGSEPDFEELASLAGELLNAPVALISVMTPNRQWFKSHVGLELTETPRSWAFCNYTILQNGVFEVSDLSRDERFAANPAVCGEPNFRFYAGAPIVDSDGYALGSLCVIDLVPRTLDKVQRNILNVLATQVAAQIKLRIKERELRRVTDELERKRSR